MKRKESKYSEAVFLYLSSNLKRRIQAHSRLTGRSISDLLREWSEAGLEGTVKHEDIMRRLLRELVRVSTDIGTLCSVLERQPSPPLASPSTGEGVSVANRGVRRKANREVKK